VSVREPRVADVDVGFLARIVDCTSVRVERQHARTATGKALPGFDPDEVRHPGDPGNEGMEVDNAAMLTLPRKRPDAGTTDCAVPARRDRLDPSIPELARLLGVEGVREGQRDEPFPTVRTEEISPACSNLRRWL